MARKKYEDKTRQEIYDEGIDAMVHSFMSLIERCVRKRCEQIMQVVEENIKENKGKQNARK